MQFGNLQAWFAFLYVAIFRVGLSYEMSNDEVEFDVADGKQCDLSLVEASSQSRRTARRGTYLRSGLRSLASFNADFAAHLDR